MKTRTRWIIAVMCLLFVAVGCWWWLASRTEPQEAFGTGRATTTPASSAETLSPKQTDNGRSQNGNASALQSATRPVVSNDASQLEARKQKTIEATGKYKALNHRPIDFYGRVLDQNDRPIPDATVLGTLAIAEGFKQSIKKFTTTTDSKGDFKFEGLTGSSLGVSAQKDGYLNATKNGWFKYSLMYRPEERYTPVPGVPAIIRLWKRQGAENLVSIEQTIRFEPKTGTILWDLVEGRVVESGGDLKITTTRDPGTIGFGKQVSWGMEIEPISGGIQEVDLETLRTTYGAPQTGYSNRFSIKMDATSPLWADGFSRILFIQSRNRQVSTKLQLSAFINRSPEEQARIVLREGVANANGTGNWEVKQP